MDNKSVKDGVLVESCTRYEARISVKRFAEAGPKIQQDTVKKNHNAFRLWTTICKRRDFENERTPSTHFDAFS